MERSIIIFGSSRLDGNIFAAITSYSIHPEGKDGFESIFINTATYFMKNI